MTFLQKCIVPLVAVGLALACTATGQEQSTQTPVGYAETLENAIAAAAPDVSKAFQSLREFEKAVIETSDALDDPMVADIRGYLSDDTSVFLTELGRRAARDQFWRKVRNQKRYESAGAVTAESRAALGLLVAYQTKKVDSDNQTWLQVQLRGRKTWPTISELGEKGSHNAWLLVQHATDSIELQRHALDLMAPLVQHGEVSKSDFAFLFDRVAVLEGRQQRYGTQVDCSGPGGAAAAMNGLEDAGAVDDLRAEMGITPNRLAEYLGAVRYCRPSPR